MVILFGTFIVSCKWISGDKETSQEKAIAEVNEAILYESDLQGIVPKGIPQEDSIEMVERFIDNWVRKELLLENKC